LPLGINYFLKPTNLCLLHLPKNKVTLYLERNNDLTLKKLAQSYENRYGIRVSLMTVHRACKRLKLNYKKTVYLAKQLRPENQFHRENFK